MFDCVITKPLMLYRRVKMKKIKKMLLCLALVVSAIVSSFSLTSCSCGSDNTSKIQDVLAMGMISATNYLQDNDGTSLGAMTTATKETIIEYTSMFEEMLNGAVAPVMSDVDKTTDATHNMYSKKLQITISSTTYTMFYNEVEEGTQTEIDDDEIETETKTFIYGIVEYSAGEATATYNVVGSREIESETKKDVVENEAELKLIFTSDILAITDSNSFDAIDEDSLTHYVKIEQELEEGEVEYKYTTKAGLTVKTIEIEWNNNKSDLKLEVEVEDGNTYKKYEIKKLSDNKYKVKLKTDNDKTYVVLVKDQNEWKFQDIEGNAI